jgi:hypothetical protein
MKNTMDASFNGSKFVSVSEDLQLRKNRMGAW